ncbi:MAG: translation elongation factor Ts [Deltaproteobacteria bacterium]|jgi:elongation factor Ts|nr:translation elongation factor Ts [Deltaproteobacteria bacterium]
MEISAKMVKELRDKTNAGMMDCKKALVESGGDMEKARDWLREHGLATVNKRSGRVAREGIVATAVSEDGKTGAIVEFNTETDFVAKLDSFRAIARNIATALSRGAACADVDALMSVSCPVSGRVFSEIINENTATTGEKSEVRRFAVMEAEGDAFVHAYNHAGDKLSVLLLVKAEKPSPAADECAHTLAMQIAASNPLSVTRDDVPPETLEREKRVAMEIAKQSGKPEKFLEQIAQGQLAKFYKECVLMEQEYIRDPKALTVKKWLDSLKGELGTVTVSAFKRYQLAEELATDPAPDA